METTKSKRRWYQFSLRTLLIFLTLACAAMAWTADKFYWKKSRWEVLRLGTTERIYSKNGKSRRDAPNPPWSLMMVGEWFLGAKAIELPTETPDAELRRVQNLFPELPVRRKAK